MLEAKNDLARPVIKKVCFWDERERKKGETRYLLPDNKVKNAAVFTRLE